MLSFLERQAALIDRRLVLLAPRSAYTAPFFNLEHSSERHSALLGEVQRLRGAIYVGDGAVRGDDLSSDGRHETAEDRNSWHFLMLTPGGKVSSCVWYLAHEGARRVEELRVRACPLGRDAAWHDTFRTAVEDELTRAGRDGLRFAEVGGWAVSRQSRCTSEGLLLALAAYSLGRLFGGPWA